MDAATQSSIVSAQLYMIFKLYRARTVGAPSGTRVEYSALSESSL
jgi:hypothetical protein